MDRVRELFWTQSKLRTESFLSLTTKSTIGSQIQLTEKKKLLFPCFHLVL